MATAARAVTVTTTATRLDSDNDNDDAQVGQAFCLYNNGAATVYIGGSGVTTAAGYPLAAGEHMTFDVSNADLTFGIVASGTVEVRVLETGV